MATKKTTTNGNEKMTQEEFVLKAIKTLRNPGYKGIHSVYSGFNGAFRKYFGEGANPVETTTKMATEGKLVVQMRKGGAMLYFPEDAPVAVNAGDAALNKMGL